MIAHFLGGFRARDRLAKLGEDDAAAGRGDLLGGGKRVLGVLARHEPVRCAFYERAMEREVVECLAARSGEEDRSADGHGLILFAGLMNCNLECRRSLIRIYPEDLTYRADPDTNTIQIASRLINPRASSMTTNARLSRDCWRMTTDQSAAWRSGEVRDGHQRQKH